MQAATPRLHLVYSTIADVPKFEIMSTECIFFIISLTIFLITAIRFKKIIRDDPDFEVGKLLIITGFGTLLSGAVTSGTYLGEVRAYEHDKTLYNSNKLSFIEGRVANFYPMPFEGHADEEFTVNDSLFHYSKYETGAVGITKQPLRAE